MSEPPGVASVVAACQLRDSADWLDSYADGQEDAYGLWVLGMKDAADHLRRHADMLEGPKGDGSIWPGE